MKVQIVDYGLGNLSNVARACRSIGHEPTFVSSINEIRNANVLLLPGVGAFASAIQHLNQRDLVHAVSAHAKEGKPLVGICLGFQLLFDFSEEGGRNNGLGLIAGSVRSFATLSQSVQVPHIGWTQVKPTIATKEFEAFEAYFTHSYFATPAERTATHSEASNRDFTFCSSVLQGNICGSQFHPEISGPRGLQFLKRMIDEVTS